MSQQNTNDETMTKAPGTCQTCGQSAPPVQQALPAASSQYIYAIGKIEARFPSQSIEKEYVQIVSRTETKGLTDRQTLHKVLSQRENRYIARQMCWVLSIEGLENYLLIPRDPTDFDLLIESMRPSPTPADIDVIIGTRGPMAPAEFCNGLQIPVVLFDQIYSFEYNTLLKAIPKPEKMDQDSFRQASAELLDRVMQMADNSGSTDAHRALNYLVVRYPAVYARVADAFENNFSLSAVDVSPSRLSGTRRIVDVIFSFTSRGTESVQKSFVRVDVSDEFPFLLTKLSPYYDR